MRELAISDAPAIFHDLSDAETARYLVRPYAHPHEAERLVKSLVDEYEQGMGITWVLALKPLGDWAGTCSFWIKTQTRAEVQFALTKAMWGQGLMSEALRTVIGYGFERRGWDTLEAYVTSENTRALALLHGLGFRSEAAQSDSHVLVLRKGDWPREMSRG